MNKRGTSSMGLILIFFALTIGVMYTQMDDAGIDKTNMTERLEITLRNATNLDLNISTPETPEIGNALTYYMNGLFLAYGEIGVWVLHFVEDSPQAPYKLLFLGLLLAICAPLIVVIFKLLVIIFLLVKEYLQNRRDKRELNKVSKNVG